MRRHFYISGEIESLLLHQGCAGVPCLTHFFADGIVTVLELIKHKMVILYCLMEYEPVRFNEMKRYLGSITDKTLSSNLKELEADQLILRKEYPQIPPKVEYSLTERGHSLMKVLDQLCVWGAENRL